jgi:peroxiredoxin-like protein
MDHSFILKASWKGGLNGDGKIATGNLEMPISIPKSLNGPGKGTNPEELLVGAAATCYLITLGAILERRKITFTRLEMESELVLGVEGGHKCKAITHRPRLVLTSGSTEEQVKTARDATDRAEKACMVSNAVRGNVEIRVAADITVG